MQLLHDTAHSVDVAEGIEEPEDTIPHAHELEVLNNQMISCMMKRA